MRFPTLLYILCGVALWSGCVSYEKYQRPDVNTERLYGDSLSFPVDTTTLADVSWREFFTDTKLQALIDTGLAHNADLRIAALRVTEAEASLRAARMAYLPPLSFAPQGGLGSFGGQSTGKSYSLTLSAEWETDLAGRLTAARRAAWASAEQYRDAQQAVRTQLIATIANTYYNLLMLDAQLSISQRTLDSWKEMFRTLQARMEVGESNDAAVSQAKANMLAVESSAVSLRQQISEQENSLSVLLGVPPQVIPRTTLSTQSVPDVPQTGVPLQLLSNRPDVRQAEHALQVAFYNVKVARAAFYPQITLSGTFGWANSDGSSIVNPGKWLTNMLGSLVQPLFNKGKNMANLRIAEARQEEALVSFRQQLLKAGSEVNDALTQWQKSDERLNLCRIQSEVLRRTVRSTALLMQHSDEASYLEVLTARQSLLQAELSVAQEQFNRIQGMIKLYHAVGGGE